MPAVGPTLRSPQRGALLSRTTAEAVVVGHTQGADQGSDRCEGAIETSRLDGVTDRTRSRELNPGASASSGRALRTAELGRAGPRTTFNELDTGNHFAAGRSR